jgi:hypothetical protein
MKKLFMFVIAAGLLVSGAYAQTSAPAEHSQSFTFVQKSTAQGTGQGVGEGKGWRLEHPEGDGNFVFYSAEMHGDGETVKGSPYTATAVTEITQHLADGNRIVHKSTASLARDGQGRTRREETVGNVGGLQANGIKIISIHDPAAGTEFVFKSGGQPGEEELHTGARVTRIEENKKVRVFTTGGPKENWIEERGEAKNESLGTQTIDGVSAEGKRETRTIPAGAIGNDRPIEIISETWYSAELHTVVLNKRNDPRMGETVYRLTDIKRGEPDASLFQPPPGMKMDNERRGRRVVIETDRKEE